MAVNLKEKILVCYDNGLFVDLASRLSQDFKEVYYYSPWKSAFPKMKSAMVGFGIEGIKRTNDFFDTIRNFDKKDLLIFFPDVYDGDLQVFLRENGYRVFGGGKGEEMELHRWDAKQHYKKVGIAVQPMVKIIGLTKLTEHLKTVKNKFIKISMYRGDMETFHHEKFSLTEPMLQKLAISFGALKELVEFIVEDSIDGEDICETGYDGFCIDGKYPSKAIFGYEIKDLGYIGQVKKYDDMSPLITDINEKLSSTLRKYKYRGFRSTEIRVGKNKIAYNLDDCCRAGSPPNELYQEMFDNLGEILWYGAEGILVDPKFRARFGIECLIHSDWANENWQAINFPKEIRKWVKLRNACKINGTYYIIPMGDGLPEIGAVVAIGNSVDEVVKKVTKMAEMVEGYRIDIKTGAIENMMEVIKKGECLGIKF